MLEKAMQEEFLPALFGEAIVDDLLVNYSGLALPNTVTNHKASNDGCSHLISELKDETTFETAKHTPTMSAVKAVIRTYIDSLHEQELKRIIDPIATVTKCTIIRSQETGKWLQTSPTYVTDICLFDTEFRDASSSIL